MRVDDVAGIICPALPGPDLVAELGGTTPVHYVVDDVASASTLCGG
jgi:hypothetical protein